MRLQEQYKCLIKIKSFINDRLKEEKEEKINELISFVDNEPMVRKLAKKDTQIYMFCNFLSIYIREREELWPRGLNYNIFDRVHSLDEVERKFLSISFGALRMESTFPDEIYQETIQNLIKENISGIAICKIVMLECARQEEDILMFANLLWINKSISNCIILLQEAKRECAKKDQIIIKLSTVWMELGCFDQALSNLNEIENKTEEIKQIYASLEGKIKNENK